MEVLASTATGILIQLPAVVFKNNVKGGREADRGERIEETGEAACHLNKTLDSFNLPEHKRESFNALGARKNTQYLWSLQ